MELKFVRALVGLGVPGAALGVLFLLFQGLHFQFSQIGPEWTAFIAVLYILIVGAITLYALHRWAPLRPRGARGIQLVEVAENDASHALSAHAATENPLLALNAGFVSSDLQPGFEIISFDEKAGRARSVVVAQGPWISVRISPNPPSSYWKDTELYEMAEPVIDLLAPPNSAGRHLECQRNRHGAAVWICRGDNVHVAMGATQIYMYGEIRSIDTTALHPHRSALGSPNARSIPFEAIEAALIDTTHRLATFAFTRLKLASPIEVTLGLDGAERFRLCYSGRYEGWMSRPGAWVQFRLANDTTVTAETVAPLLREIWSVCGLPSARFPRGN